ncbi:MAG: TIGR04283 family arsenosugar biosynthesis glycosyltransferase [Casimicrobiaceae bacterium]
MLGDGVDHGGGTRMKPQLCIVIPVLDEADRLAPWLAKLQPLRRRGVQLVLVDGGSVDGTLELARGHADIVFQAPRGRAAQMNAGAAASRAEVLLFLHADTELPEGADALVLAAVANDRRWGRFDVQFDARDALLQLVARLMNLRSRITGIATGDQALFVCRDLFEAVGGFPEIPLMEDVAISRALGRLGLPACLHAKVVTSARRWVRNGVWKTIFLMWRLRAAYFFGADPARLALRYGNPRRES